MLLRYSRNILFYSRKLHVIKIIPFITTYFSSNLIANFFDFMVQVKEAIHPVQLRVSGITFIKNANQVDI